MTRPRSKAHACRHVTPEDAEVTTGTRPLYAFGLRWVARVSGRAHRTVRKGLADGIPLWDPLEAVAWAVARSSPELADRLLEHFAEHGYAPRYVPPAEPSEAG